ncbi:nitrate reductase molybdenum cofactor assembly chaperone [Actinomadura roseirufa]|uniref:nitrate reductase molybdenum cofactor assembly chaperone n=1 Tax=Actinomadura roseirufa TaxID=2094049 RepID=UPI001041ACAF|nr:nitrate reductase molybdenum cofactor assembly chaperone [Actinomadura roseirufa]
MIEPIIWQSASLLLDYPGPGWPRTLSLVAESLAGAESPAAGALRRFAERERATPPLEREERYVVTFDRSRRRTLFMTYYTDGDTRNRGAALAAIKAGYRAEGWAPDAAELPDFLPLMLEFAARCPVPGLSLLARHRPGAELLRLALHDHNSVYAPVLDAVCATLPEAGAADRRALRTLARTGPPVETVGRTEGVPR